IAFGNRSLRNTVRGEYHREFRSMFGACLLQTSAQFFREGLGKQRLVVPLVDKIQIERNSAFANHGAAVKANASARILRRETDGDDALVSLARNRLHRIG